MQASADWRKLDVFHRISANVADSEWAARRNGRPRVQGFATHRLRIHRTHPV